MARYMRSNLEQEIEAINQTGGRNGRTTYLKVQARNGYTAIDEYSVRQGGGAICLRNIQCGTPRECRESAMEWAAN
ncbi:hypothetical protein [Stenotrophomonas phage RAS14]